MRHLQQTNAELLMHDYLIQPRLAIKQYSHQTIKLEWKKQKRT